MNRILRLKVCSGLRRLDWERGGQAGWVRGRMRQGTCTGDPNWQVEEGRRGVPRGEGMMGELREGVTKLI